MASHTQPAVTTEHISLADPAHARTVTDRLVKQVRAEVDHGVPAPPCRLVVDNAHQMLSPGLLGATPMGLLADVVYLVRRSGGTGVRVVLRADPAHPLVPVAADAAVRGDIDLEDSGPAAAPA